MFNKIKKIQTKNILAINDFVVNCFGKKEDL